MSIKWKECATYKPEVDKIVVLKLWDQETNTYWFVSGYYTELDQWYDIWDAYVSSLKPHFWCYQEDIE